jgi:low affinity Fe/Cu permease
MRDKLKSLFMIGFTTSIFFIFLSIITLVGFLQSITIFEKEDDDIFLKPDTIIRIDTFFIDYPKIDIKDKKEDDTVRKSIERVINITETKPEKKILETEMVIKIDTSSLIISDTSMKIDSDSLNYQIFEK